MVGRPPLVDGYRMGAISGYFEKGFVASEDEEKQ